MAKRKRTVSRKTRAKISRALKGNKNAKGRRRRKKR